MATAASPLALEIAKGSLLRLKQGAATVFIADPEVAEVVRRRMLACLDACVRLKADHDGKRCKSAYRHGLRDSLSLLPSDLHGRQR